MLISYALGQTSIILRVKIRSTATTPAGQGLTGLTNSSSGLVISTIADNEATATAYTSAASKIQTITTLGTFAAPTSGDVRFKEVDSTNHPGLYELQIDNARFNVSSAKSLTVTISGAANMFECDFVIPLVSVNPYDGVRAGLTALPNVASGSAGAIPTTGTGSNQISVSSGQVIIQSGTGTGQLSFTGGVVAANVTQTLGSASVGQSGYMGIDWSQIFSMTSVVSLPNTTLGTVSSVTGNVGGNVAGSVGSVNGAVGSVTGNVGGNVVGSVGSVSASVTVGAFTSGLLKNGFLQVDVESWLGVNAAALYTGTDTPGTTTLLTRLPQAVLFDGPGFVKSDPQTSVTVGTNNDKTGYALSSGGVTAVQLGLATSSALSLLASAISAAFIAVEGQTSLIGTNGADSPNAITAQATVAKLATMLVDSGGNWTYTTDALKNAPSGGATPEQVAAAVWQDLISSGDFAAANSIGKLLLGYLTGTPAGQIFPFNPQAFTLNWESNYAQSQAFSAGVDMTGWTQAVAVIRTSHQVSETDPEDANALMVVRISNPTASGDGITIYNGLGDGVGAADGSLTVVDGSGGWIVTLALDANAFTVPQGTPLYLEICWYKGSVKQSPAIARGEIVTTPAIRQSVSPA